ncbi:GNAT family N-acetyltransferase [Sedimentibacter sp. MB31-C6]|uniref:GNAT family N-acetyltransferase n=1 Tax=Sedimentibacter sp. MB31-C6 TaxID=3109366 RepID=UPI002DDCC809|nr:GNAT family N-acetyltransferase [Sedimentibacter sp. MB36-C1]WSI04854.1 GNAT family N-acetyltransferase [Sedimentibacter sp. MB36-C1]
MNNNITLKKIDESNFIDCFNLKLKKGQEEYVSHPIRSLAQAYVYYSQCIPFGIYYAEKMVGYVMIIYDYDEETYNIWHMMIDGIEQGKGYGRNALNCVLEYIRQKPFGKSEVVLLTCNPNNLSAYHLYKKMGFKETGKTDEDEVELKILLS